MRGQVITPLIFIITFIVIWTAWQGFGLTLGSGEGIVKNVEIQQDLHVMDNALETAREYLGTAFKYSIYQAYYDFGVSKKVWHNGSDVSPTKGEIEEMIKSHITKYMNQYTLDPYTFLDSKYQVEFPNYQIFISNNTARATPERTLKIERSRLKESIVLEKQSFMSFDVGFYDAVLEEAKKFLKSENNQSNELRNIFDQYMADNWKISGNYSVAGCENMAWTNRVTSQWVYFGDGTDQSVLTSWDKIAENEKAKLESEAGEQMTILRSNLNNNSMFSWNLNITNSTLTIDPLCGITEINNCDSGGDYSYTQACNFTYSYVGDVHVSIQDTRKQLPVKTISGDIRFENLTLGFIQSLDIIYPSRNL